MSDSLVLYEKGRREGFNQGIDTAILVIELMETLKQEDLSKWKEVLRNQKHGQRRKKKLIK